MRIAARRTATFIAVLACAAATAYLLFFLFGPTYTRCSITQILPGQVASGPGECSSVSWVQMTFNDPGPKDLRALWFLGAWTLAPYVALVGTRIRSTMPAVALVAIALLVDLTSIISMGGGFVYAILCGPLLLLALVATATSRMG